MSGFINNNNVSELKYEDVDVTITKSLYSNSKEYGVDGSSSKSTTSIRKIGEIETVSFDSKETCNDRFRKGDNYNRENLDIIVGREQNRDQYGNKVGYTYSNTDEVITDLEKLERIYNDFAGFSYYNQNLYLETYKYDTIQVAGCCPVCFAMIASYLLKDDILPTEVIDAFRPYCYETGTDVTGNCFPDLCNKYDLECKRVNWTSKRDIVNTLKEGKPIILNVTSGDFTRTGHYIVLLGLARNGEVIVADPNSVSNSTRTYPVDRLIEQTNNTDSAAWCFGR